MKFKIQNSKFKVAIRNLKLQNRKVGFTLMELIVVMAIIAIIASFVLGAGQPARRKAREAKAKAAIASLEVAIGMYSLDMGSYPATTNAALVTALTTSPGGTNWKGPYMQFETTDIVGGTFMDPWATAYTYNNPGTNHGTGANHTTYVDIWSWGQNKANNNGDYNPATGADDISNWR